MLRAADSSQLLWNLSVCIGTASVCPSIRIGFEISLSALASFPIVGIESGSSVSVPDGKKAACFKLTTRPRGVMLISTLPCLISSARSADKAFNEEESSTISGVGSAVEGLTRGLAVDLAPIRVNCVAPGAIPETDVWSGMSEEQMTSMVADLKKKSLTGRVGLVEDIAEGYVYLLKGNFTNGQTLLMDGGEYLN